MAVIYHLKSPRNAQHYAYFFELAPLAHSIRLLATSKGSEISLPDERQGNHKECSQVDLLMS